MMYSGDEDCGDDCTSGIFPAYEEGDCPDCGATADEPCDDDCPSYDEDAI